MLPYLLVFCRLTIGLLFAYAFVGKVRDLAGFAQTITNFKLLPPRWSKWVALLFLGGELAVVGLLVWGGQLLLLAFGLALLLLVAFTAALVSVLVRNIQTTCNCFGKRDQPVTYGDVWRNGGLVLVTATGLWTTKSMVYVNATLNLAELLILSLIASVFVLIWTNLHNIVVLFKLA